MTNNSHGYLMPDHRPLELSIQLQISHENDANKGFSDDDREEPWIIHQTVICPQHEPESFDNGESIIASVWQVSALDPCRQRIAVYSGTAILDSITSGSCCSNSLHVSFQLPEYAHPPCAIPNSALASSTALCWTVFPDMHPTHRVLCCLLTSNSLCVWDVYPQSSTYGENNASIIPSEGWTITLPFECRAIFSIPGAGGGLLLQRLEDSEDRVVMTAVSAAEDDGFFLKGPPAAHNSQQNLAPTIMMEPQLHLPTAISTAVPSLFSLQHPLEDVLPVVESFSSAASASAVSRQQSQALHAFIRVTDVFEKLLWVGTTTWFDVGNDEDDEEIQPSINSAVIAVTYHTVLGRHAVWKIDEAPVADEPPPLFQILSATYNCNTASNILDSQNDMIMMDDLELLQDPISATGKQQKASNVGISRHPVLSTLPPRLSRAEALADALGVRRTPRKSLDVPKTRYRHADQFFSPSATSPANMTRRSGADFPVTTTSAAGGVGEAGNISANEAFSVFASKSINSRTAVTCLYREQNDASTPADNIFLASNIESGSHLILCMVCKRKSPATRNGHNKELKLFTLKPEKVDKLSPTFSISIQVCKEIVPCVSAQPVQASPVPHCFLIRPKVGGRGRRLSAKSLATDILVLGKRGILTLQRGSVPITTCALSNASEIMDITNPVRNLLTFHCKDECQTSFSARGKLSLIPENCAFVENILSAIDSGFSANISDTNRDSKEPSSLFLKVLALKIRADCCRLAQSMAIARDRKVNDVSGDTALDSMRTVLQSVALNDSSAAGAYASKKLPHTKVSEKNVWHNLLDSDFHLSYAKENDFFLGPEVGNLAKLSSGKCRDCESATSTLVSIRSLALLHIRATKTKCASQSTVFARIFDALHFTYEDLKLYVSTCQSEKLQLVSLLVDLCQTVINSEDSRSPLPELFLDHYRKDYGDDILSCCATMAGGTKSNNKRTNFGRFFTSFNTPPSIFAWVDSALRCSSERLHASWYNHRRLAEVNAACSWTRSLIRVFTVFLSPACNADQRVQRDVDVVRVLLEEGFVEFATIRDELPSGIALPLLDVLSRIRNHTLCSDFTFSSPEAWMLVGRDDVRRNMSERVLQTALPCTEDNEHLVRAFESTSIRRKSVVDEDNDGLVPIEHESASLFRDDNRVHEAARLLRSSRPIFLRVARAVEVSDHDYERLKQERLQLLCFRSMALPIGRGMLTLGKLSPVPAELLPLPELCLKGRLPPTNGTLNLDISECPADMRVWPDFHNGVAAGLRLPIDGDMTGMGFRITRTWIVYNRPPPSRSQVDEATNTANLHSQHKSFSHGGLLLALGLRGHLTALEMSDIYDYLTHGAVTTTVGVLLGLAANKRGSCDISVSKMLCLHIPSLIPQHFSAIDVACSVQTAAVIGAGLLFQKSSHRMMTEFLLNEIGKRPDSDVSAFDREAYTLACGLALGTVNLSINEKSGIIDRSAGIADLCIEERLFRYITGGVDKEESRRTRESNDRFSLPTISGNDSEKCSTIYEGDQINTDMTAPGAILALGLMHMKAGNLTIASALALPDTHFLLEFVRPDFLTLRVISRALILWHDVQPTKKWIKQQIPTVVRAAYEDMRSVAKTAFGSRTSSSVKARPKPDYDRRAVRQVYTHVVAGACFGIGLRFAGTGDKRAKEALYDQVLGLHTLREANDPVSLASRPEFPILETCIGCAAISLAMVLAGTGDLDALRLFKLLRWRCDKSSSFGSHMIYGMAIGLLFLGGGTCTIGREPEDIAALITAFFPRFPMTTSDNQCHLQALRHFYALAVKRKELRAIDVETGEVANVPVDIVLDGPGPAYRLNVPALLRNTDDKVKHLRVASNLYYALKIDISDANSPLIFYVKKRSTSWTGLLGAHLTRNAFPALSKTQLSNVSGNALLSVFASYLCQSERCIPRSALGDIDVVSQSVNDCLDENSEEALLLYISLRDSFARMEIGGEGASILLRNVSLIRTYYRERRRIVGSSSQHLASTDVFLPYIEEITEELHSVKQIV